MSTYIMVMRDDCYWIIGPFASQKAAAEWGRDPLNNSKDDPRWQTIELADPHLAPLVVSPDAARETGL